MRIKEQHIEDSPFFSNPKYWKEMADLFERCENWKEQWFIDYLKANDFSSVQEFKDLMEDEYIDYWRIAVIEYLYTRKGITFN